MRGYLYLQTHPEHPGLVRFLIAERNPDLNRADAGAEIRYIARFNDVDAARMHVQNALHGRLIDLDARIYRTGLAEAIAVVEADNLSHERIWIDPALDAQLDGLIAKIAAAQEPDGYLYTARTNECDRLRNWTGAERWVNINRSHELYNAGHLFEAAAAHFQATGKRSATRTNRKRGHYIQSRPLGDERAK